MTAPEVTPVTRLLDQPRVDRYAEAARDWSQLSLDVYPADPPTYMKPARVLAVVMQSLALNGLGETEAARDSLDDVALEIDAALAEFQPDVLPNGWHDWLIADILRREAEGLIGGGDAEK